MNIHPFHSSFNAQEPCQKSPKLSSPSYTKTSQTLYNNFTVSHHPSMASNRNHSRENDKKSIQNSNDRTKTKPDTKLPDHSHYLIIDNIKWNNDRAFFNSSMELKVQYTVTRPLEENISWQVTYLGSAYTQENDQVMIQFETEENQKGSSFPEKRQFKLSLQPPKWHLISSQELFATTAITISASYKAQEFVKVGYYIHYQLPELTKAEKDCVSRLQSLQHREQKQDKRQDIGKKKKIAKKISKRPSTRSHSHNRQTQGKILQVVLSRTVRTILGDKPRIIKFEIDWQKQALSEEGSKIQMEGESTGILQNQHLITEYLKPQQFIPIEPCLE